MIANTRDGYITDYVFEWCSTCHVYGAPITGVLVSVGGVRFTCHPEPFSKVAVYYPPSYYGGVDYSVNGGTK